MLIVAGHGIRLAGAKEKFLKFVEKYNIPVVTTFNGFDLIPNDHPCYKGRIGTIGTVEGNKALQEADIIYFIGTRNNIRQTGHNIKTFAPNALIKIFVDNDRNELMRQEGIPMFKILQDAGLFIEEELMK